jgi:hypothetical protein
MYMVEMEEIPMPPDNVVPPKRTVLQKGWTFFDEKKWLFLIGGLILLAIAFWPKGGLPPLIGDPEVDYCNQNPNDVEQCNCTARNISIHLNEQLATKKCVSWPTNFTGSGSVDMEFYIIDNTTLSQVYHTLTAPRNVTIDSDATKRQSCFVFGSEYLGIKVFGTALNHDNESERFFVLDHGCATAVPK